MDTIAICLFSSECCRKDCPLKCYEKEALRFADLFRGFDPHSWLDWDYCCEDCEDKNRKMKWDTHK